MLQSGVNFLHVSLSSCSSDFISEDTSAIRRASQWGGSWCCPGSDSEPEAGPAQPASQTQPKVCLPLEGSRAPRWPFQVVTVFCFVCLIACFLEQIFCLFVGVESEDFLPFWSSTEIVHQFRHLLSPDPMLGPVVGAKHIHEG